MQPSLPPPFQQLVDRVSSVRDGLLSIYEQAAQDEVVGEAGGLVRVTAKGNGEVTGIELDRQLRRRDLSQIEDLVLQAVQDAQAAAKARLERAAAPLLTPPA